jgi:hypothetical protein
VLIGQSCVAQREIVRRVSYMSPDFYGADI